MNEIRFMQLVAKFKDEFKYDRDFASDVVGFLETVENTIGILQDEESSSEYKAHALAILEERLIALMD